ncbi:MAG: hypothetical protein WCB12_02720 [Bryobacteraceae bacterium]
MPASFGYNGIWLAKFTVSGCHERVTLTNNPAATDLPLLPPPGTYVTGMQFDNSIAQSLTLPIGSVNPADTSVTQVADQLVDIQVLGSTPGAADTLLLYPHQYPQFASQDVFFQQDGKRTFFVIPRVSREIWRWSLLSSTVLANLSTPVRYYSSSYTPAVNTPTLVSAVTSVQSAPTPPAAAPKAAVTATSFDTNVMASGILTWAGEWYPPAPITFWTAEFVYQPFSHPFVCNFISAVKEYGIDGLLKWPEPSTPLPAWPTPPSPTPLQLLSNDYFAATYSPRAVAQPYPTDNVDFTYSGAYSQYNWELFYHAPMLLASQLSQNQQFEDAQNWLHYIFDPTSLYPVPPPGAASNFPYGYWKVKPFYEQTTDYSITQLLTLLDSSATGHQDAIQNFQQQVSVSMSDPFAPFAIARLRTTAFQKAAVMAYLNNLIAWADNLFIQDTRETINEATQLYILADQLLGPRPQEVQRAGSAPLAYKDLAAQFVSGDLSDPLVQLENALPVTSGQLVPQVPLPYAPSPMPSALYFCVPPNPQLLSYWDTVADRLYKIRHCQNIAGQVQQLPLLAPPIPPGLLIQAAAAGVDLSSVLNAFLAPPPLYHFPYLYKQAIDFCKEVHTLGTMLLSALEKSDAEQLAALRATQEASLLALMRQEYVQRLQQATDEQQDLAEYRQRIQDKHDWYATQPFAYEAEDNALQLRELASFANTSALLLEGGAAIAHLIPSLDAGATGAGGSPTAKVKFGGHNAGFSASSVAKALERVASNLKLQAEAAAAKGALEARQAAWQREIKLAQDELTEIDTTKTAIVVLKVAMAQSQLDDFDAKTQDAQNVAQFLLTKFTNQQLYDWMVGQISGVYFQSYQLAYQMAKRAEAAYNFDLANYSAAFVSFVQPSYWDNLHQGLLAAEGLMYDVERMESSFVDNNFHEFEIIRPISLSQLDATAFQTLVTTGTAFFTLPESLFDADYPGHFMRRIKYAGVTFTFSTKTRPVFVNCTLTLMSSSIRITATPATPYGRTGPGDARFHDLNQVQQIVTSNGGIVSSSSTTPDNGMFETTVHYIITDDRLLTFEHSGVIGTWQIEFSKQNPGFDPTTVTDIALQLEYNARYGGDALKTAAGG